MFVKSVSFLPASVKSMNPIQKFPHITESFACARKMLAIIFLFPTIFLISSGTCSAPKLSKQTISFLLQNKAIPCVPRSAYSSSLLRMPHLL